MTDYLMDAVEFDEVIALALAAGAGQEQPGPDVRTRLLARLEEKKAALPAGFSFRLAHDTDWIAHPVPGIRMKILSLNRAQRYATLLLDVDPGTRLPAHRHSGDEECYVLSGSLVACGRRIGAGDFHHADAHSDHGELWSDEGCQVLLIVAPEDFLPPSLQ
jgi:anti-sigma factor ChrR (cupin superfamily)